MGEETIEDRVRKLELAHAVSDERWKGLVFRLNLITALILLLIGGAVSGNRFLTWVGWLFGAH